MPKHSADLLEKSELAAGPGRLVGRGGGGDDNVALPQALLALSNSCAMADVLHGATGRFDKLFKRRAHVHHFTEYMEADGLVEARDAVKATADAYARMRNAPVPDEALELLQRLKGTATT